MVTPADFTMFLSDAERNPFSRNSFFAAMCMCSNVECVSGISYTPYNSVI